MKTTMYKTILVPHAGTAAGDEALKHAIHFAKGTSAKIIIFNVIEEIRHPVTFVLGSPEKDALFKSIKEANESLREDMEKVMETRTQQCKDNNIDVEIKVEIGDAAEKILELVEKENIDLIVMSKRRKLKGMKKLLSLGSVSRKIVEHVTCPVTLIDIEKI